MITGNETITPQLKYRQEWEDRMDGDSLGLVNYTEGGITLKQHMVVEFTKAFTLNGNVRRISFLDRLRLYFTDHHVTVNNNYNYPGNVKSAIELANEVIKQLNDEGQ